MPILVDQPPRFSEQEAVRLAESHYGLQVSTVGPLPSYIDQNFRMTDAQGRSYVLKLAHSSEERMILDMQIRAMQHLEGEAIPCPHVYATSAGEVITRVEGGDSNHLMHMLGFLEGRMLGNVNPHTPTLLHNWGRFMGRIDAALGDFEHPAMHRKLGWDLKHALDSRPYASCIHDAERRSMVETLFDRFENSVLPALSGLRTSVIHNDGNDYNMLVDKAGRSIVGIIDFGDMVHSFTVCEPAIASAYAMLNRSNPLTAGAQIVAGYHTVMPLSEEELTVLYPLILTRLAVMVCNSAYRIKLDPDNEYLLISEKPAWRVLEQLKEVDPAFGHYVLREACGLEPCPQFHTVADWLQSHQAECASVVPIDLKTEPTVTFDLGVGSLEWGTVDPNDTERFTKLLFDRMKQEKATAGLGRYNEPRWCYTSETFRSVGAETDEWRTVHIGLDVFMPTGSPVFVPLDGTVHSFQDNDTALNYGPTVILEHRVDNGGLTFYTLYGHLSRSSLKDLERGRLIRRGEPIGTLGDMSENGGWPPHLHFQIMTDMLGLEGDFPGVCKPSERRIWLSLCPDPGLMFGIETSASNGMDKAAILEARRRNLSQSLSISYQKPIHMVRGSGAFLYDADGQAYLDCVNNVCHVGHCHPKVVEAGQRQMAVLNTNTRYLHENIIRYAKRLAATMPDPLRVCFFVNSGSEANDLALRLARTHTGRLDTLVLDSAYHGNLSSLIEISPYKFNSRGGKGEPPHIHTLLMPDGYRGPYRGNRRNVGAQYARHVQEAIDRVEREGRKVGTFIAESVLGCGGQVVLPDGYLEDAFKVVRSAGGVCIADEVQVGFGRVGTHFWGFQTQGVVPDIVTMGKPIGNGHPIGAVVTTREIAASFHNGMEYFNTFGGNPVSCAVGLAVLEVIESEGLQENALNVGNYFQKSLKKLQARHPIIGDVRGLGLFIGVELVRDRTTLEPAAGEASYIIERMRDHRILLSTDGPLHNVIKIKPPIVLTNRDVDRIVETLDKVLAEDAVQVG